MPRNVRLATGLAFALHGLFIITTRYRLSYDAYTHMFFGDHYRLDWWSLWETRWYTGFEVTSYPPLVHQLIGLFGRLLGVEAAFAILIWLVLSAYPVGIYLFSRIFTGERAAGYAALAGAVLPSIFLTAHTFGQLPTLASTLLALFAMAALFEFLRGGSWLNGALAVGLVGTVLAAHHATLLFLPWAAGAVALALFLNSRANRKVMLGRMAIFAVSSAVIGLLVIWPFWLWGLRQSMQVPIDHLSRHNFLADSSAPLLFFWPIYGPLVLLIPLALWKGFRRRYFGLWAAFLFLFVLGLGGTTRLPMLLFGNQWQWLTYDRFAFWASLLLLPFFGMAMVYVCHGRSLPWRRITLLSFYTLMAAVSLVAGFLPTLLPTQPNPLDMQPILDFLNVADRSRWRYVTFGFGDQFAALSRLTTAVTIDGSYHTARLLPELRGSGIGQIDSSFWLQDGLTKLGPILRKSADWGVRWGFVNRQEYIPLLRQNGWVPVTTLANRVQVWENPEAVLQPPVLPPPEDPLAVFSWGVLPMLTLAATGALAAVRLRPAAARQALFALHSIAIGLLPVGLGFWYFRTLAAIDHPKVYFTYDQSLFYISDALALIAVLAWAIGRIVPDPEKKISAPNPFWRKVDFWFLSLCLLATFSTVWSIDWRVTLFASLHLWLVFGLFLSLQDRPGAWRTFALGSFAALFLQGLIGFAEFAGQSTTFLTPLGIQWPGDLSGATPGASVVQLLDGARWLRVYGSLPHPNILGGLIFICLAGAISFYLLDARLHVLALFLIGLGLVLLVLTFSRSAWMALALFGLLVAIRFRRFERKRLVILAIVGTIFLAAAVISLWPLIFARSGSQSSHSEQFSLIGRTWLAQESWLFIRERPLTGLGMGGFILSLAQRAGYGYIVEPVHNIPLLVASELGIAGVVILAAMAFLIALHSIRTRNPQTILFSALLAGLGAISLFDHYLWTLAPGRMLLGSALGLMAAQMRLDESRS